VSTEAEVHLWGRRIAGVLDEPGQPAAVFQFAAEFAASGIEVHQMSLNGKRDDFTVADLEAVARRASLKRGTAARVHEQVRAAVHDWPRFAAEAEVPEPRAEQIRLAHRLELPIA
jgi:serine/threonine-protein kinase HipA